jgi:hypothetical protein
MHHQLGLMTLLGVPQRLHVAPAQCPIAGFDLAIFGGDTGDSAPFYLRGLKSVNLTYTRARPGND